MGIFASHTCVSGSNAHVILIFASGTYGFLMRLVMSMLVNLTVLLVISRCGGKSSVRICCCRGGCDSMERVTFVGGSILSGQIRWHVISSFSYCAELVGSRY